MVKLFTLTIGLVGILGLVTPLSGHHSFAAFYLEDETMEIEGEILEVQFKAPHIWIHVAARDAFGKSKIYAAEWANPSRLERESITKDTLKMGDMVRIWGSPSRDLSDNKIHLKRILRPRDKWEWRPAQRSTR